MKDLCRLIPLIGLCLIAAGCTSLDPDFYQPKETYPDKIPLSVGVKINSTPTGDTNGVVDGARGQSFLFILDLLDLIQDLMEPRVRIP